MIKDPDVFLNHILDSIGAIEEYTIDLSEEGFLASQEKQDAIIRRVEIIGEAVRNLPLEFRKQHPQVSWKKISGMRDKIVHEYFGVDTELVWEVIKKDLPPLKEQIRKILKESE